jgi:hypothetical protein
MGEPHNFQDERLDGYLMNKPEQPKANIRLPYAKIIAGVPTALGAVAFALAGGSQLASETPKVAYIGFLVSGLLALATVGIWRQED